MSFDKKIIGGPLPGVSQADYDQAFRIGRAPNAQQLFADSNAFIVSGKVVNSAMQLKGKAMTIAANARNPWVMIGSLRAAQRANAAITLEIAKSEGGVQDSYCPVNFLNMGSWAAQVADKYGITIPFSLHADHYGIKSEKDLATASYELPVMFASGITSIAIDASHLSFGENVFANRQLILPNANGRRLIPTWAMLETEIGEIVGKDGLSTPEEALFHIAALNSMGILPDLIALNNGSAHGLEATGAGIQVELTQQMHDAIAKFFVDGAQHGTSGNDYAKLMAIMQQTNTRKANVATALQMISYGIRVNEFGNAIKLANGQFDKDPNAGVTMDVWNKMLAMEGFGFAFQQVGKPTYEIMAKQPEDVQERMIQAVEDQVYAYLVNVFNAANTAPLAVKAILDANGYAIPARASVIEDPAKWTDEYIKTEGDKLQQAAVDRKAGKVTVDDEEAVPIG